MSAQQSTASTDASAATPTEFLAVVSVALLVAVHLLALVVFPNGLALVELAALEATLGVLIGGALGVVERSVRAGVLAAVGITGSAVGAWWLTTQSGADLWVVTLGVATVAALAMYVVHRYELVMLGLVEEST